LQRGNGLSGGWNYGQARSSGSAGLRGGAPRFPATGPDTSPDPSPGGDPRTRHTRGHPPEFQPLSRSRRVDHNHTIAGIRGCGARIAAPAPPIRRPLRADGFLGVLPGARGTGLSRSGKTSTTGALAAMAGDRQDLTRAQFLRQRGKTSYYDMEAVRSRVAELQSEAIRLETRGITWRSDSRGKSPYHQQGADDDRALPDYEERSASIRTIRARLNNRGALYNGTPCDPAGRRGFRCQPCALRRTSGVALFNSRPGQSILYGDYAALRWI